MADANRPHDRHVGIGSGVDTQPDAPGTAPDAGDLLARAVAGAGLGWLTWDAGRGEVHVWDPRGAFAGAGLAPGAGSLSGFLEGVCADQRSRAEEVFLGEVEGSRDVELVCTTTDDDGNPCVVEVRGQVFRDGDGTLHGTALLRDVSELQAREGRLHASLRRFRQGFESAPIAVALTSPQDVLLDVNAAFERLTGYARDEVVGRNAKQLGFWSSGEDQAVVAARLREDTPAREPLEVHIRTKTGRVREVLLSITEGPLDHLGGYVKVMLDVTERRGSERKLVQAVREVMKDTSWLARGLLEKLGELEGYRVDGPSLSELTHRERDVLSLVADGLSNKQIAERLGIASSTVRNYMNSLYMKLGVESRPAAVVWARERGLGGE